MKKAHDDGAFDKLYAQRRAEAEARHQALRDEGDAGAAKADRLEKGLDHDKNTRKRKKEKGEALALKEAQLTERGAALLVELERGGSTELDDDGAVEPLDMEPFREDEEALQDLVDAKENGEDVDAALIKKKRKALGMRKTRARQALAAKALQRRVALLEIRVAELEKELRARGSVSLI